MVTSSHLLGRSTSGRLLTALAGADLVVAEPEPGRRRGPRARGPGLDRGPGADRAARCDDPLLTGLDIRVDVGTEYDTASGCFTGEHGHLVARPRDGVTLLGASGLLSNEEVLRADNAAVALRLLGQRDRLVWYVPEVEDLVGDDGVSLRTLVPEWIFPGLWIAGATVLALLLWRVRRLGPLVTEPLPVTVKAIETTHSRGRLYRKSGDRAHAAARAPARDPHVVGHPAAPRLPRSPTRKRWCVTWRGTSAARSTRWPRCCRPPLPRRRPTTT